MRVVDVGSGPPIVVIPGIQGRWEWMKPAIDALAHQCRVLTFSLADERGCGAHFDPTSGFDCYVEQVRAALDTAGIERAAICGVSYGGLIAATFAARHRERVASLVLVSAIPPSWKPDRRIRFYLRAPRLLSPLFCVASVRMYREIAAAASGRLAGARAALRHGWTALTHMFSPERMARRVRLLATLDLSAELARVDVATLLVTGDAGLDRVVPVRLTKQYLNLWSHARVVTIERTGHLGLITRPEEFTRIVASFVTENAGKPVARRRVG
jgi:pimeloyl-ACP methyl ester carboxylesterase